MNHMAKNIYTTRPTNIGEICMIHLVGTKKDTKKKIMPTSCTLIVCPFYLEIAGRVLNTLDTLRQPGQCYVANSFTQVDARQ